MIKVFFLINTLGGGGAENVLVNLVNHMNTAKYDIKVGTMYDLGVNSNRIKSSIPVIDGNPLKIRGLSKIIRFIPNLLLKRIYVKNNNYDVVIAYMHGGPTKVLQKCKSKKIAWLHTDITESNFNKAFISNKNARSAFGKFDNVVGVSKEVTHSFKKRFGMEEKLLTIYNAIDKRNIIEKSTEKKETVKNKKLLITSIGRLQEEKGYDRLIGIFSDLVNKGYDIQLQIIGEGSGRKELEFMIQEKGLNKSVELLGYKTNPYKYLVESDIYVCSSHVEGFNTVLCEAMILGVPIVTTEVAGAKEILGENNEYGLIVKNDAESLHAGLELMIKNSKLREEYKSKSVIRSEMFDINIAVKNVEDLIDQLLLS